MFNQIWVPHGSNGPRKQCPCWANVCPHNSVPQNPKVKTCSHAEYRIPRIPHFLDGNLWRALYPWFMGKYHCSQWWHTHFGSLNPSMRGNVAVLITFHCISILCLQGEVISWFIHPNYSAGNKPIPGMIAIPTTTAMLGMVFYVLWSGVPSLILHRIGWEKLHLTSLSIRWKTMVSCRFYLQPI